MKTNTAKQECANCRFYDRDSRPLYGLCRRFPKHLLVDDSYACISDRDGKRWCGEWRRDWRRAWAKLLKAGKALFGG
jgi:hypothetical protein